MDPKVAVVGFAFGLRVEEPNPSNTALAVKVLGASEFIKRKKSVPIVVTQWEITKALKEKYLFDVDLTVGLRPDGTYLDSKGVWVVVKKRLEREGVTQVIIVAQPFLHLPKLKEMVFADGYEVIDYKIGAIPFDNSELNTQPWTRTKIALVIYAVKSLLGMRPGHNGMQNAS